MIVRIVSRSLVAGGMFGNFPLFTGIVLKVGPGYRGYNSVRVACGT